MLTADWLRPSSPAALTMVPALVIACVSQVSVEDEIRRKELAVLQVPELDFTRIFSLVTRRGVYHSQVHNAFRAFAMVQGAEPLA